MIKKSLLLTVTLLNFCITIMADNACTQQPLVQVYSIRSQGVNAPRHLAGILDQIYTNDTHECPWGFLSATVEYGRSIKSSQIAKSLFGEYLNSCDRITISGSQVADRGPRDLLADYFYLPMDFKSTVMIHPQITNTLVDMNWYLGLDTWLCGLYLFVAAPITHTRWNIGLHESILNKGVQPYPATYATPDSLDRGKMYQSFSEYAQGTSIPTIIQKKERNNPAANAPQTSVIWEPLQKAKLSNTHLVATRLADFRFDIGWNFIMDDCYHVGVAVQTAIPSGTRFSGEYMFEPQVGNGHFWELGGRAHGHYTFWNSDDECSSVGLYGDIAITHLFRTTQDRTFDLKGKPLSRYMLAELMATPIEDNLLAGGVAPMAEINDKDVPIQFKNRLAPIANISNLSVEVTIAAQVDAVALLHITHRNFNVDLGYNFWARSCEQVKLNQFQLSLKHWSIKGDSFVFGIDPNGLQPTASLSAAQNTATINAGSNFPATGANSAQIIIGSANPNISTPALATAFAGNNQLFNTDLTLPINTSKNPDVIELLEDVDVCQGRTSGRSHTFFANIGYSWADDCCSTWLPFIGVGGQAELANNGTDTECSGCVRSAISQWGVWLKGGISFN